MLKRTRSEALNVARNYFTHNYVLLHNEAYTCTIVLPQFSFLFPSIQTHTCTISKGDILLILSIISALIVALLVVLLTISLTMVGFGLPQKAVIFNIFLFT